MTGKENSRLSAVKPHQEHASLMNTPLSYGRNAHKAVSDIMNDSTRPHHFIATPSN